MAADPTTHATDDDVDAPGHDDHGHDEHGHGDDDHGHDDHDDHGDHPADDPKWVLLPVLAGLVIGIVLVVVLGIDPDVPFYRSL